MTAVNVQWIVGMAALVFVVVGVWLILAQPFWVMESPPQSSADAKVCLPRVAVACILSAVVSAAVPVYVMQQQAAACPTETLNPKPEAESKAHRE